MGREVIFNLVLSLVIALALGPIVIPRMRKLKFGQAIREDGPQSHLQKTGTPTMGGLIFLVAFFAVLLFRGVIDIYILLIIVATLGMGVIGFIDDYIIVVTKNNEGLKPRFKMLGQLIVGITVALIAGQLGTDTFIPFFNTYIDLGVFFYPLVVFMLVAMSNATNLTDGLDGLNGSVTTFVTLFFTLAAFKMANLSVSATGAAMIGGLLGFLFYNKYPAKIFMGDLGSLALGGFVSAMALALKIPLLIVLVGFIYVLETLSVIIQVSYFKKTGKRVFLMSPIHHHYEEKGIKETRIVLMFCIVTVIMSVISWWILF